MAEGKSTTEKEISEVSPNMSSVNFSPSPVPPSQPPRVKQKLSRPASRGWSNKSFDQSALTQNSGLSFHKPIRRQSSVSDFFQSMLTKSRSHLFSLFTGAKKENTNRRQSMLDISAQTKSSLEVNSSEDSLSRSSLYRQKSHDSPGLNTITTHHLNSSPKLTQASDSQDQPNGKDQTRQQPSSPLSQPTDTLHFKEPYSATERFSSPEMFIVSKSNQLPRRSSMIPEISHKNFNSDEVERHEVKSKFMFTPRQSSDLTSSSLSENTDNNSITFSVIDFTDRGHEGTEEDLEKQQALFPYRQISSAPVGQRQSLSIESTFLVAAGKDNRTLISNTKRALVKSNSDTLTKFSHVLAPIVKASSDGNCFQNYQTQTSISPTAPSSMRNVLTRITDYLFLGSVEAAYSEPLLCKHKITSLVDITNISPRVVPLHKKSDCPCACVNKSHFRSKLNIGVDDIEWENLEQYFKEINAFIDGARLKRGRTLVFSYMGQSRAPAAVIQHLMHHYEMSYKEAFNIVVSKRPQTKINSGFVKTLNRLEKNLALVKDKNGLKDIPQPTPSPTKFCDSEAEERRIKDGMEQQRLPESVPPVVRGAWLEC